VRHALYRLLRRFVDIRREEAPVVGWCWLLIFAVLSSYYIMRPIRDEAGVAGGVNNLQWLFTGTLVGMVLANIPFAYLVKKLPRRCFIPLTYHFFAANIVLFAALFHWADAQQTVWVGRIFFIWVSVYNLFVVSVFWQLNVDLFSPEQSKRLFGLIAAGASIGAIVGSGVTAGLARHVSPIVLLAGAAALLEIAVLSVGRLSRLSPPPGVAPGSAAAAEAPIGGLWLALSRQHQRFRPAVHGHLDDPLFPAGRHRQPQHRRARGADRVLCDGRFVRQHPDARDPAAVDRAHRGDAGGGADARVVAGADHYRF
jgi:AAA family ATP:ADP antiporter